MPVAGKTILITGATDGIGLLAAKELGRQGAIVHLVGRDPAKLGRAADAVAAASRGTAPTTHLADLSSQASIRSLAEQLKGTLSKIDVLVNNAGGLFERRQVSVDGIEMTFALNHLGYFLLTHELLDLVAESGDGRIVSVASDAHAGAKLDFDDLQGEGGYSGWGAYCRSKLANILWTYELARRLEGRPVTANCLHPGFVASNFAGNANGLIGWAIGAAKRVVALSVEKGALTPIYLSASDEVQGVTGKYFVKCKATQSSPRSTNAEDARRLWSISERLTGISP